MSDRSKPPATYWLIPMEPDDPDNTEYTWQTAPEDDIYPSRQAALDSCWAHRDAIIREELLSLMREIHEDAEGAQVRNPAMAQGLRIARDTVAERIDQLEDPDAK